VQHARPAMWVGSIDAFGDFWNKRAQTVLSTAAVPGGGETVTVDAVRGVTGLTLDFPRAMRVVGTEGTTATAVRQGSAIVLGPIGAGQRIVVTVAPL
jgi:hypothetical protein